MYKKAKLNWKCYECSNFDDKHFDSGYIHCSTCDIWRHKMCTPRFDNVSNDFKCQSCNSRLVPQTPDNSPNNSENDYSSGDDFVTSFPTHKQKKRW